MCVCVCVCVCVYVYAMKSYKYNALFIIKDYSISMIDHLYQSKDRVDTKSTELCDC